MRVPSPARAKRVLAAAATTMVAAAFFLCGCTTGGANSVELPTPWGILEFEGAPPQTDELAVMERRLQYLSACVARRKVEGIDTQLCCYTHGLPARFCDTTALPKVTEQPVRVREEAVQPAAAIPVVEADEWDALLDQIRVAEGLVLVPQHGHICYGHSIRAGERFANMTVAECELLLIDDVLEARDEAMRVFGRDDNGRVEACYWAACARWGSVPPEQLPDAIRKDARLHDVDATRAARIARTIAAEDAGR